MTGRNAAWRPAPVIEWLIRDAWRIANRRILVEELCGRLLAEGVPLWRFTAHTPTLHPEMMGDTFVWLRASGHASYETAAHAMKATPLFTRSPLLAAAKARAPLRRRLAGAEAELDFPLLKQLSREGATDYVVLPLEFSNGSLAFATLASDHPDGFSPAHLALFDDLRLVLARRARSSSPASLRSGCSTPMSAAMPASASCVARCCAAAATPFAPRCGSATCAASPR